MAKPRVFISSTHHDLRHVRETLIEFTTAYGFEPVVTENGGITYLPDRALEASCAHAVTSTNLFLLIISGRAGSEAGALPSLGRRPSFYEEYRSVTRVEYESAVANKLFIYVLIDRSVFNDYQTFLKNSTNRRIDYPHAESINVFLLIQAIEMSARRPPILTFDKTSEMTEWLRSQWAGLVMEALQPPIQKAPELGVNDLTNANRFSSIQPHRNRLVRFLTTDCGVSLESVRHAVVAAPSLDAFVRQLQREPEVDQFMLGVFDRVAAARTRALKDLNRMRASGGLPHVLN